MLAIKPSVIAISPETVVRIALWLPQWDHRERPLTLENTRRKPNVVTGRRSTTLLSIGLGIIRKYAMQNHYKISACVTAMFSF